jgi:hypothetical protein
MRFEGHDDLRLAACAQAMQGVRLPPVRRLQVSGHELKGDGGLAYG